MKNLLLTTIIFGFSSTLYAQTFHIQESTRRADFSVCQKNHNIILNKFISQADNQAATLMRGIQIESTKKIKDQHIRSYKHLLIQVLTKKIALEELKKQLASKNLKNFYNTHSNYNLPILQPDKINIDFGSAINKSVDSINNYKNLKIGKEFLGDLKFDLARESAKLLISKQYRSIATGLFTRIVTNQASQAVSATALKSATVSFTSKLFVNVGTGLLLDILTFPLHGYRLPPETEWLNLLEDHPEVIIVPEWMTKAGSSDHPWSTHCNTIQRQTKHLERVLNTALKNDNQGVKNSIIRIFNYYSQNFKDEPNSPENRYGHTPVAIDNTYVHRPRILPNSVGPYWMQL